MVCEKHTMGSEIVCTHLGELLGDVGCVKSHLGPFGESVSVRAR
jgi:hypothetical protein